MTPHALASGSELEGPNGILAESDSLTVVTFGGKSILRLGREESASLRLVAQLPAGQLDGVVRRRDGSLLVSSWEARGVYRVSAQGGTVKLVIDGVTSPADIGWDSKRHRVLIPVFQENRVLIRRVD
jgi:hypothetical protein